MFKRRAGSVRNSEPKLIWVKALETPRINADIDLLREKFNAILEEALAARGHNYIMTVKSVKGYYFDHSNHMLEPGRVNFWKEINSLTQEFDKG